MDQDEVFQLALLCLTDSIADILAKRTPNIHSKRGYWIDKMKKCIVAIDSTYVGHLPDNFVDNADAFNKKVELELMELLSSYKVGGM